MCCFFMETLMHPFFAPPAAALPFLMPADSPFSALRPLQGGLSAARYCLCASAPVYLFLNSLFNGSLKGISASEIFLAKR